MTTLTTLTVWADEIQMDDMFVTDARYGGHHVTVDSVSRERGLEYDLLIVATNRGPVPFLPTDRVEILRPV